MTPQDRALRARMAAHISWANTTDATARTAAARQAAMDRFDRQVDPEGLLNPQERHRRAEHARKAHYLSMALKSAEVRRARKLA